MRHLLVLALFLAFSLPAWAITGFGSFESKFRPVSPDRADYEAGTVVLAEVVAPRELGAVGLTGLEVGDLVMVTVMEPGVRYRVTSGQTTVELVVGRDGVLRLAPRYSWA